MIAQRAGETIRNDSENFSNQRVKLYPVSRYAATDALGAYTHVAYVPNSVSIRHQGLHTTRLARCGGPVATHPCRLCTPHDNGASCAQPWGRGASATSWVGTYACMQARGCVVHVGATPSALHKSPGSTGCPYAGRARKFSPSASASPGATQIRHGDEPSLMLSRE